jgi:hypothetical protein
MNFDALIQAKEISGVKVCDPSKTQDPSAFIFADTDSDCVAFMMKSDKHSGCNFEHVLEALSILLKEHNSKQPCREYEQALSQIESAISNLKHKSTPVSDAEIVSEVK